MEQEESLLEDLTKALHCAYLSDLYRPRLRERLRPILSEIDAAQYSTRQWNDTASYILHTNCQFPNAQEAKNHLLQSL